MSRDPKSDHYDVGGIEVFDVIKVKLTKDQFEGYLLGNAIKYSLRLNWKGDKIRDSEKHANYSQWHSEYLKEKLEEDELEAESLIKFVKYLEDWVEENAPEDLLRSEVALPDIIVDMLSESKNLKEREEYLKNWVRKNIPLHWMSKSYSTKEIVEVVIGIMSEWLEAKPTIEKLKERVYELENSESHK